MSDLFKNDDNIEQQILFEGIKTNHHERQKFNNENHEDVLAVRF